MPNGIELDDEDAIIVSTVFHLPEDFFIDTMLEEGFELTRDEETLLMNAMSEIRIYFEINPAMGKVYVLGVR